MKQVHLQPAYVLHTRPYRNTSLLVDFYTHSFGRIGAVARGVRSARNAGKALLQPFTPLLISWRRGHSDLVTLTQVEGDTGAGRTTLSLSLQGACLLAGFYVNELMVRLIKTGDPAQELFWVYQRALESLSNTYFSEKNLRIFEKNLLAVLGYGITFDCDTVGNRIVPSSLYTYEPQKGFKICSGILPGRGSFYGSSLLSFDKEELQDSQSLRDAKHLMQQILASHLGYKPLHSRRLFLK